MSLASLSFDEFKSSQSTLSAAQRLGSIAQSVTTSALLTESNKGLIRRYKLQNHARALLPDFRVSMCHRSIVPLGKNEPLHDRVLLYANKEKAAWQNVVTCGSGTACPICGVKIAERHVCNVEKVIKFVENAGGGAAMFTFTLRHQRDDKLEFVADTLLAAWKSFINGRAWALARRRYGIWGYVRTWDHTFGHNNGHHPHLHVLVFFKQPVGDGKGHNLPAFEASIGWFKARWVWALEKHGLVGDKSLWEHGLDITSSDIKIADYLQKWGRLPSEETLSRWEKWGLEAEVGRSQVKKGFHEGYSASDLLALSCAGAVWAGKAWVEYARYMKGKHLLEWSRSPFLPTLAGVVSESDEEVAAEGESLPLFRIIEGEMWRAIVASHKRGQVAAAAVLSLREENAFIFEGALDALKVPDYQPLPPKPLPEPQSSRADWLPDNCPLPVVSWGEDFEFVTQKTLGLRGVGWADLDIGERNYVGVYIKNLEVYRVRLLWGYLGEPERRLARSAGRYEAEDRLLQVLRSGDFKPFKLWLQALDGLPRRGAADD